ncbi:hypothetical protein GCM10007304_07420 [Rhodococcoides trifolii]|uniref:Uncharacterized protein n=1 Tax=Rhodococcoides trifolii TaxID=908250 RepID=A0A917CU02_9NOCA|nr:hypothetical protein GCM10007304_07420 [Rhodococcus trifolii]
MIFPRGPAQAVMDSSIAAATRAIFAFMGRNANFERKQPHSPSGGIDVHLEVYAGTTLRDDDNGPSAD